MNAGILLIRVGTEFPIESYDPESEVMISKKLQPSQNKKHRDIINLDYSWVEIGPNSSG